MIPPPTALSNLAWTPDEAALVLAPKADAELLGLLAGRLLAEVSPGRYPADDLIGLHSALAPWLPAPARRPAMLASVA